MDERFADQSRSNVAVKLAAQSRERLDRLVDYALSSQALELTPETGGLDLKSMMEMAAENPRRKAALADAKRTDG